MTDTNLPFNGAHFRDENGAEINPMRSSALTLPILSVHGTLISFLQVKFQGLDICESKLNCAFLSSYAVTIFLCFASFAASNEPLILTVYRDWVPIFSRISSLLALLSTALLAMILAPPLGCLLFLVWLLVFIKVVRESGARFGTLVSEAIGNMNWYGFGDGFGFWSGFGVGFGVGFGFGPGLSFGWSMPDSSIFRPSD